MTTPHSELSDRGQLGALNDKPCLITYLRRRSGQCNEGRRPGTKRVVVVPLGLIAVQSAFVTCVINAAVTMSPIIVICSFTFILTQGLSSHNPPPPWPVLLSEDSLFRLLLLILGEDGTALVL